MKTVAIALALFLPGGLLLLASWALGRALWFAWKREPRDLRPAQKLTAAWASVRWRDVWRDAPLILRG